MSKLTYNGVTLPFCENTSFRQEAVADDSNTDWYLTRIEIITNCVICSDYIELVASDLVVAGNPATTNPAALMKVIRSRLLTRRKSLSYTFNGFELMPGKQAGMTGPIDAKNGPTPVSCNVSRLTDTSFLVQYHIIGHYWENNQVDAQGNPIVSNRPGSPILLNRWTESVDIDSCNYTTKTRRGRFIIRSDNSERRRVDDYRYAMAGLSVPDGFIRASSNYMISPDGLAMDYTVTDKEVFKMPPNPAFEADGHYTEHSTNMGAVRYGEVWVALRGSKDTSQAQLLRVATAVCAEKLNINGKITVLEGVTATIGMYDNFVNVRMRCQFGPRKFGPGDKALGGLNPILSMVHTPLSSFKEPGPPNYKNNYGTASIMLQAAAYFDPNIEPRIDPETNQLDRGKEPGTAGNGE